MQIEIKNKITQLNHLLESAQKPKISWEEMQLISENAFTLQDELMALLDKAEKTEQDIPELQTIFATREVVWDAIAQIAKQEMSVKDKTLKTKKTATDQSRGAGTPHGTCCCHEHAHTCCGETHQKESHSCCCHKEESTKNGDSHCYTSECNCHKNLNTNSCCDHTDSCDKKSDLGCSSSECGCHHSDDTSSYHEKPFEPLEHHHSGACSCKKKK